MAEASDSPSGGFVKKAILHGDFNDVEEVTLPIEKAMDITGFPNEIIISRKPQDLFGKRVEFVDVRPQRGPFDYEGCVVKVIGVITGFSVDTLSGEITLAIGHFGYVDIRKCRLLDDK